MLQRKHARASSAVLLRAKAAQEVADVIDEKLRFNSQLPNAKKETAGSDPAPEGGCVYANSEPKVIKQLVVLKHPDLLQFRGSNKRRRASAALIY